nr:PREDICTED: kelch-like protein 10 [Austrofundulus limnaeus]
MSERQKVLMELLQEGTLCDAVLTAAGDVHFKVRLLLLPSEYLLDTLSKHKLVRNNLQCLDLFTSHIKIIRESKSEKPLTRTRLPPQYLLAVGGIEDSLPTDKIELYNVRNNSWVTVYKTQKVLPEFCSALYLGGNIYYIGGSDGDHYFSSMKRFNLATKTWQEVGPMHVARSQASVAALRGRIYAVGGCDEFQTHSSAERFDPDTNQWTLISPMNVARADAGSATLHERVYVCGGFGTNETLFTAEFYNPDTDQWTQITPMDNYRIGAGVITYNNRLFVIGGYNGDRHTSGVSVYDPASQTWHSVASMLHRRINFGVAVLEGQLYVAGGFHGDKKPCSRVERYDGKNNKWHIVENMEAPRGSLSCCVVDRSSLTAANK